MKKDTSPEILYKYISWTNDYQRRIINDKELFFSSMEQFNDPFDSAASIRYDLDSDENTRERMTEIFKRTLLNPDQSQIDNAVDVYLKKSYHKDESTIAISAGLQAIKRARDFGIFSLSDTNQNLLMWSHYSDSHRGLCIGFDTEQLVSFQKDAMAVQEVLFDLFMVRYSKEFPVLVPKDMSAEERENIAIIPFLYKSNDWHYEHEYRLICINGAKKVLHYPPQLIRRIDFGAKMEWDAIESIIDICNEVGISCTYSKANLSKDKYSLEFIEL